MILAVSGVACLLLLTRAYAADPGPGTADLLTKIKSDLAHGQAVIVYRMQNKNRRSEQYADWAAGLNQFYATHRGHYRVYAANQAFNSELTKSKIKLKNSYTVFMKRGSPSYYYEGVILEKAVYTAVDNHYSGKPVSTLDRAFLPEVISFKLD
ncbi:MAG: hypothetical protein P8Z72_07995 [Gammaproteobacteria bacterium]